MYFIGFSGYAQSGKDTLADIVDNTDIYYYEDYYDELRKIKIPLAKELKEYCEKDFGIISSGSAKKDDMRRATYQFMGRLGRTLHPDLWIRLMKLQAYEYCNEMGIDPDDMHVIIPDVRHFNELDFIYENRGICFAVDADKRMGDELNKPMYKHESEINIPAIRNIIKEKDERFVLINNTMEELNQSQKQIFKLIAEWKGI